MALTGNEEVPIFGGIGPLANDLVRRVTTQAIADDGGIDEVPVFSGPGPLASPDAERMTLTEIAAGGTAEVPLFDGSGPLAAPSLVRRATATEIKALAGGGAYHAKAVHFDSSSGTRLIIGAAGADAAKVLYSLWVANATLPPDPGVNDIIFLTSYPNNNFETDTQQTLGPGFVASALQIQLNNQFYSTSNSFFPLTGWTNIIFSYDAAAGTAQCYVNGAGLDFYTTVQGTQGPTGTITGLRNLSVGFGVENSIRFGDDGYTGDNGYFDCADVQFWNGVSTDLRVAGNLAKFISGGKPVNPSVAAAAFGRQTILYSGDHASFPINQGTLGAATITGPPLTDAPSSPSD
jgi:hypothetical protein